jgi:hypothetical protein
MVKCKDAKELSLNLEQFIGTEQWWKHWLPGLVYTDGVKYLAEQAGAHWLIDVVASYRRKEPFQIWELKVCPSPENGTSRAATVTMIEDTDQPELVRQEIPYTDFPLDYIKLYLIDGVLLLPSEY